MASCPICSNLLLRHIHSGHSYFYCQSCRLEMPEAVRGVQKLTEPSQSKTETFPAQVMTSTTLANSIEVLAK